MLKKTMKLALGGLTLMLMGMQAYAGIITLTPSTAGMIAGNTLTPPTSTSNCEAGCVYDAFNLINNPGTQDDLQLLYKADVGTTTTESGSFTASYDTVFANTPSDPADATITWITSSLKISCPECYLAVKDGNHTPSYYFFNLSNIPSTATTDAQTPIWNGEDTIQLTGFWPDQGAISHVSIWGREGGGPVTEVPEPASLGLLGLGLLAIGAIRRRKIVQG